MLADIDVRYVIVGHSERRQYFGETDIDVNKKVHAALNAGLRQSHSFHTKLLKSSVLYAILCVTANANF